MRASQTRSIFRRRQRLLLVDAKKLSADLDFWVERGKNCGAPTMRTDAQIFAAPHYLSAMARLHSWKWPWLRGGSEATHDDL